MKKIICKLFGHRSIIVFSWTHKWEHDNWAQCSTVHICERCGYENRQEWQQGV
jgi:hypothetical protein